MDITSINGITSDFLKDFAKTNSISQNNENSFQAILSSAINAIDETNQLQNAAESAEIQFALGESNNTHDLLVAETKASVALQYTVAVRDKVIDAYKEIMQMSI